jgi:hypothetical protein
MQTHSIKSSNFKNEILIFLILLAISVPISYSHFASWENGTERSVHQSHALFSGDEPSYLEIVSVMVHHNSIHIDDYYKNPDSDPDFLYPPLYYEVDSCRLHHSLLAQDGHCYSSHQPGLAFLLFPGYFLGGLLGVMFTMNVIFSLCGVVIYKISTKFATSKVSLVSTLLFSLGTLLLTFSGEIYPELVIGFFILLAFYIFFKCENNLLNLAFVGSILGFFPLLKTAFIAFPVILIPIFVLVLLKKRNLKGISVLLLSFLILIISFFWYLDVSTPALSERSHGFGGTYSSLAVDILGKNFDETFEKIKIGWANLLFGQSYGLFLFSPLALVSLFGIKYLWPNDKALLFSMISIFLVFVLALSITIPYAAGWTHPSRYLLPLLPMLSIPLAPLFEKFSRKILFHLTILLSTYIGVSFNIIFSRVIYGHTSVEFRKESAESVYFGISKIFPYLGQANGSEIDYFWTGYASYFFLIPIVLLSLFGIFFFKDTIQRNLTSPKRKILLISFIGITFLSILGFSYPTIIENTYESSIISIYQSNFHRSPELSEISFWKNKLLNNDVLIEQLELKILNSPESKIELEIMEYYNTYLNRDPDKAGLTHWKNTILNDGKSTDWVQNQIKNSPEALKK